MKNRIILFLFSLNALIYAQISLSEKAVDYFSMFNLSEGAKLANMLIDMEPQSFLMAGPDGSGWLLENGGDIKILDLGMHYRMNRVGIGPVSLSAEYKNSLLHFEDFSTGYDPDGSIEDAIEEEYRLKYPELAAENLDSTFIQGSVTLFDALEIGGMLTKVDQIDYRSYEMNVLDLSQIFGEHYLYLGETPVFKLSRIRTFNILTVENGTIPAYSSYTYLGMPLLNSLSYDVFPEDRLTFISPTFNITRGPFMVFATPKWETNHSRLISFSLGTDWAYFITYRMKGESRDLEQLKDMMTVKMTSLNRDDMYNNGSFRILLGYQYGQYNPYASLNESDPYHAITLSCDTYMISIDRRPYSPNAISEMKRGDYTHSPYKRPFGLVMLAGLSMDIRYSEERGFSLIEGIHFKLGIPWFRNGTKRKE